MGRVIRHYDWRPRLLAYVSSAARKPFKPGQHDCALFFAGAVHAMTGVDYARGWRSKYRSLRKGRELIQAEGHDDHVALVATVLEEIPPSFAQVGDGVAVPGDDMHALGIVQGARVWVLRPDGLGTVPLTDAVRAFRV